MSVPARHTKKIEIALILIGLAVLFFCLPHFVSGDGYLRFRALRRLSETGQIVRTGHSMIGPLFAFLLWPLGKLYESAEWWIARFNCFVFAGGLFVFYRLLKDKLDPSVVRKFLLILLIGSMFPSHLKDFYGEVFTAVVVGAALLATQVGHPRWSRWAGWGWAGVVVGAVNTPAAMVGVGTVAASETLYKKRFRYLLVPVAAAGLVLFESWVRRGSPWLTGYEGNAGAETILTYSGQPGFSYPLFLGVLSLLFSFGKGLVFFAPGLLLSFGGAMASLKEELRRSYRLWIWFLVGLVLVYSKWWAWYGGWTWGPRFLLFASIPASFALAVGLSGVGKSVGKNLLVLLLLAASFWVGANGAVFGLDYLEDCRAADYEFLCWYVPEFSVLWRPFVARDLPDGREAALLGYGLLVFAYLAGPLVRALGGGLRKGFSDLGTRYLGTGWRF